VGPLDLFTSLDSLDSLDPLDISRTVADGALTFPGDPPVALRRQAPTPAAPYALTHLEGLTTHVLTHVDAPRHFLPQGATLDEIPLRRFAGPALVVDVTGPAVLPEHLPEGDLRGLNLLFRTRHSREPAAPQTFDPGHVYVSAGAAADLAAGGVNLVGIDYLSVDRSGDGAFPAHTTLLAGDVLILEGLDLAAAPPGRYRLLAFPLKIDRADGAPVRAVLFPA
jgi:arylformamidase